MTLRHLTEKARTVARRLLNQAGIRKKKVFAVGFNKCGTASLYTLFQSLGLLSDHGVKWRQCDDLKLLRTYDCFTDGPPEDLAKLDRLFPGSRFILQVRDLEGWVYSRLAHIERSKERNTFKGGSPEWDNTEYAVKSWIKKRNTHHRFVLSYFSERPADLLVVNFIRDESAATKVCRFLGHEGERERPRKNVNPSKERPPKHTEMLHNCIRELGIPEHELAFDILCPSAESDEAQAEFPFDSGMLEATTSRFR